MTDGVADHSDEFDKFDNTDDSNDFDVSDGIELKERINKKSSLSLHTEPSPQTQISKYNQKSLV